jgi:hypothetical protein
MGEDEIFGPEYGPAVCDQVQIERPGGAWSRAPAAMRPFDPEQPRQKCRRIESRGGGGCRVEKARLGTDVNRFGIDEAGDANVVENAVKVADGGAKVRRTVAQVAPEGDRD